MINFLRLLLWPFSLIYGLVIAIRNYLYDWGILKSQKFDLPVIVVGNLAVGGTGKSPLTEYLIRLLKDSYKIATLSRGYGRKTKGFIYVEKTDSADRVGDEPLQFKNNYPEITVAVCEDRVTGVEKLKNSNEVILLDDAFQHRALIPGFSILLLDYANLFKPRLLLPAGNFRDSFVQRKRADIIIVSKSPSTLSEEKRREALRKVKALTNQQVLFSSLSYGIPYCASDNLENYGNLEKGRDLKQDGCILLVTGIANPKPLLNYLQEKWNTVKILSYADHHHYTRKDIETIIRTFKAIKSDRKYFLTTEKDFQRLKIYLKDPVFAELPIWIIPVEVSFNDRDKQLLSALIFKTVARDTLKR